MPHADFTHVSEENQKRVKNGLVGYDWVPGCFGPPPGILKKDMAKIGMYSFNTLTILIPVILFVYL